MLIGLLNGLIVHLKFKGLWDLYKLTRSNLDVIFTPPVEYQQYRRQKLLASKMEMLKAVVGEEAVTKLFSEEFALQYFMDWDKDTIAQNAHQRFIEQVKHTREEAFIEKVKTHGRIDFADEELGLSSSLKDILMDSVTPDTAESNKSTESSGDEFEDEGGDVDLGSDEDFSDMSTGEAEPEPEVEL